MVKLYEFYKGGYSHNKRYTTEVRLKITLIGVDEKIAKEISESPRDY